jgi:hypothetical protein
VLVLLAESIKELQRAPAKRNLQVCRKYRGSGAIAAFPSFNVMLGAKLFRLSRRHCLFVALLFPLLLSSLLFNLLLFICY